MLGEKPMMPAATTSQEAITHHGRAATPRAIFANTSPTTSADVIRCRMAFDA